MSDLCIDEVWDYYDAPLCGTAHLADVQLYYIWIDDVVRERDGHRFKVRYYTAYTLDAPTWAFLREDRRLTDASDPDTTPTEAELARWEKVGEINEALVKTDGVVSFTSSSIAFPVCR